MNANLLIDAIVRQTTILIAQLATASGRAPLAHIANKIFLDLTEELSAQGVGKKVIADMFGISLRTYHAKVRRLSESATQKGQSLWEAVLEHIRKQDVVSRVNVLRRFRNDDEAVVRSVLRDLAENNFIFKSGRGNTSLYRATTAEDVEQLDPQDPQDAVTALVWVLIHHHRPVDRATLKEFVQVSDVQLDLALEQLSLDRRVQEVSDTSPTQYTCDDCVIPVGAGVGWEAALFDHYQALVASIVNKLTHKDHASHIRDQNGGSTYAYDIWPGHPLEAEILSQLQTSRDAASSLRAKVHELASQRPPQITDEELFRVVFYMGQSVIFTDE